MQVNLKTYLSILKQVSHEWFDNFFLFATALVHNVKPLVILIRLMKIEHTESIQTICEWAKPTESIYAICLRKLQTALKTKTAKRKPFVWRRYDVSKQKKWESFILGKCFKCNCMEKRAIFPTFCTINPCWLFGRWTPNMVFQLLLK